MSRVRIKELICALYFTITLTSLVVNGYLECYKNETWCPLSDDCISSTWICDGEKDCVHGSDETFCSLDEFISCPINKFQCSDGTCIPRSGFCNRQINCVDASDEFYCNINNLTSCPHNWIICADGLRCIQGNWKCDGYKNCPDGSDENACGDASINRTYAVSHIFSAMDNNIRWLLSRKKSESSTNKWGHELHRTAIALYLADPRFFAPRNNTGEEIGYELNIQLLSMLSRNITMRSEELALYIQGLLVTCIDPKNFFSFNLVSELRRRVESSNYTNPFEILVLCNAEDKMSNNDIEKVTRAYNSQHRPFWIDTQAISVMAMQCLSTAPNVQVDERRLKDMEVKLKKRQFRNGTVDNFITTAVVLQALMNNNSYIENFDAVAAISVLIKNQKRDGSWGSIRNSYYALPALGFKSLVHINTKHCVRRQESEGDVIQMLKDLRGDTFVIMYSIWLGKDVDLGKTWRFRMKTSRNNTFYDVIETVRKLDSKHNVTYNVIDDKPYVSSLYGKEDDPELGVYWFTYVRSLNATETPTLINRSPVDVKVLPKQ